MAPYADPTPLTTRPDQEATKGHAGAERGHSPPVPMADGVHQAKRLDVTGGHSRSFEGDEA